MRFINSISLIAWYIKHNYEMNLHWFTFEFEFSGAKYTIDTCSKKSPQKVLKKIKLKSLFYILSLQRLWLKWITLLSERTLKSNFIQSKSNHVRRAHQVSWVCTNDLDIHVHTHRRSLVLKQYSYGGDIEKTVNFLDNSAITVRVGKISDLDVK